MANLSYVNVFCKDIIKLSNFYIKTFNFKEIKEIRSPIFRGVDTGKSAIGFNAMAVYNLLDIKKFSKTNGAKFLLNFDARSMKEVDILTQRAKKKKSSRRKDKEDEGELALKNSRIARASQDFELCKWTLSGARIFFKDR